MAYLGKQPALQSNEFREEFNITSTTSTIATSGFVVSGKSNYLDVYKNGVLLGSDDYTLGADRKTITLASNAIAGDIIVVIGRRNLTQGVRFSERRHEHTIANNETTVTFPYPLTGDSTDVYLNGVKLASSDFSINVSTKVISFTVNPVNGDVIAIVSREPATSSSTVLPIVDSNGGSVISESNGNVVVNAGTANIGSNALVVDASGNIGINNTSPNNKLTVGTVNGLSNSLISAVYGGNSFEWGHNNPAGYRSTLGAFNGGGHPFIGLSTEAGSTSNTFRTRGLKGVVIHTGNAGDFRVSTVNNSNADNQTATNRLLINSEGNMRIIAAGGTGDGNLLIQNTESTGNVGNIYSSINSNGNSTSSWHLKATTQNVNSWYLYGNGTSSFGSDERIKKNIETTRDGYIEDIKNLRVVKYHWKNQDETTSKELGLIAQEVEQVFPGLIQEHELENVGEDIKHIKMSVIPFILIKGMQEQQALIESQQEQINNLIAEVEALKAQ